MSFFSALIFGIFITFLLYSISNSSERKLVELQSKEPTVYLDLETTGLSASKDEVLEIAIIDDNGNTLLHSYVKPIKRKRWLKAQSIHGITPEMVADAPTLDELTPQIRDACNKKRVVIYNARFDTKFLYKRLGGAKVSCCMLRFSEFMAIPSQYDDGYKWHKLEVAARKAKHKWNGKAHTALADAQATRTVWLFLNEKRIAIRRY